MNRKISCFIMFITLVGIASSQTVRPGRLAVSADGNNHDRDDIGATPIALAMLARSGVAVKSKLVHYEYNNHIWGNYSTAQKSDMTYSTLTAASRYGFPSKIFFSAIDNPTAAYNHLAYEINQSTSTNPLYILAMGPMGTICEGIKRSYSSRRQYVTVISHSTWNDTHSHNGSCTWTGVQATGVKTIHIVNQNAPYFATNNYADVSWFPSYPDANLRWVWSRMQISHTYYSAADVSDAGEMWYWLKYDQYGNFRKLKSYFSCIASTTNRTVKICSPSSGSTMGNSVHLQAQVTDSSRITVKIYVDGVAKMQTSSADIDWNTTLADGTHTITVKAWDSSGSFSTSARFTTT